VQTSNVSSISSKKTIDSGVIAHGGELKNHEVPVLNMTDVGKFPLNITRKIN
jgi:hypothetical protein